MDRIAFEVIDGGEYDGDSVRILVNGVDLAELARRVESAEVERGERGPAGAYGGLSMKVAVSRHLLGEPEPLRSDDARVYVLDCDCGCPGCWPLLARIEIGASDVTWSDFAQAHRAWDLSQLGPFRFDRAQYEAAWRELVAR